MPRFSSSQFWKNILHDVLTNFSIPLLLYTDGIYRIKKTEIVTELCKCFICIIVVEQLFSFKYHLSIKLYKYIGNQRRFKGRAGEGSCTSAVGHMIRIHRETQGQKPYVEGRDPAEVQSEYGERL